MVGIQSACAELVHCVHINHLFQIVVIPGLDLLDLVGSSEAVEEVDERNLALESCHMGNNRQVHNFLNAGLTQHRAAGLTACVNVGVVAENG